jgi:hypothetical protein
MIHAFANSALVSLRRLAAMHVGSPLLTTQPAQSAIDGCSCRMAESWALHEGSSPTSFPRQSNRTNPTAFAERPPGFWEIGRRTVGGPTDSYAPYRPRCPSPPSTETPVRDACAPAEPTCYLVIRLSGLSGNPDSPHGPWRIIRLYSFPGRIAALCGTHRAERLIQQMDSLSDVSWAWHPWMLSG